MLNGNVLTQPHFRYHSWFSLVNAPMQVGLPLSGLRTDVGHPFRVDYLRVTLRRLATDQSPGFAWIA